MTRPPYADPTFAAVAEMDGRSVVQWADVVMAEETPYLRKQRLREVPQRVRDEVYALVIKRCDAKGIRAFRDRGVRYPSDNDPGTNYGGSE